MKPIGHGLNFDWAQGPTRQAGLLPRHLTCRIYIAGDQLISVELKIVMKKKRQLCSMVIKLQENLADGSGEREPFSRGPTGDTAWRHLPPFRGTRWGRDAAKQGQCQKRTFLERNLKAVAAAATVTR